MRTSFHILFRVDNIINAIVDLDEEVKDNFVVWIFLRSPPSRYNPKVSTLEELSKVDTIFVDKFHVTLSTYDLRIKENKLGVKKKHSR